MHQPSLHFTPLAREHLPLLWAWHSEPHVQEHYSLRTWTLEEIENKYGPRLETPSSVLGYVVLVDKEPIGYLQYYRWAEHPYPDQELDQAIVDHAAGIDYFIGSPQHVGQGLGSKMISAFIEEVLPEEYSYVIADPAVSNLVSIAALKRCGFKPHRVIQSTNALG
ncbi:MAG: GNAT family N-acetyltransferase, partial [Chlamydiia bacterium]